MSKPTKKQTPGKSVDSFTHEGEKRRNIPTVEHRSIMHEELKTPLQVEYARRNPDLDPQLIWRGKKILEEDTLSVPAPPLYIQEKVHPQALIQDLLQKTKAGRASEENLLFGDFNGLPKGADKTDFYQHDQNWTNRMVLGDSLQVMTSLAEREGLRGKVQCIYFDPPYGIKFNSNFQWSTTSRDVKDGNAGHITREPEQVKAFRDTWRDGIHSYLSYLRDRLIVARDLLTDSGSIFVQIGDENVHRVRAVMDEVFGEENFVNLITVRKTSGLGSSGLPSICDFIVWYSKKKEFLKYRQPLTIKPIGKGSMYNTIEINYFSRRLTQEERDNPSIISQDALFFRYTDLVSSGRTETCIFPTLFEQRKFEPGRGKSWRTNPIGMEKIKKAGRLGAPGSTLQLKTYHSDFPALPLNNIWDDVGGEPDKTYVVQTSIEIIKRCILMSTDPGDLVLDPTCGSGMNLP